MGKESRKAQPSLKETFLALRSYKGYWRKRKQAWLQSEAKLWQRPFSVSLSRTSQPSHKAGFCCLCSSHQQFPWFSRAEDRYTWKKNQPSYQRQPKQPWRKLISNFPCVIKVGGNSKWYWIKVSWLTQSNLAWLQEENDKSASLLVVLPEQGDHRWPNMRQGVDTHSLASWRPGARGSRRQSP